MGEEIPPTWAMPAHQQQMHPPATPQRLAPPSQPVHPHPQQPLQHQPSAMAPPPTAAAPSSSSGYHPQQQQVQYQQQHPPQQHQQMYTSQPHPPVPPPLADQQQQQQVTNQVQQVQQQHQQVVQQQQVQQQQPQRPKMSSLLPQPKGTILSVKTPDEETEDGRIQNREASKKIQDDWIYKQIWARAKEFTKYTQARILLGTWNVNAKSAEELDSWLCQNWGPNGEHAPDIIAVGLQEMVDLNAVNVAVDNKSALKSQAWQERIRLTLNSRKNANHDPNRAYIHLETKYLVGLMLCVFVKQQHRHRVKHILADSVGVGVMGMMGNKGGVSIRLQFYDSTICITNSHLAAHRENVAGRNADFHNVYSKTSFNIGTEAVKEVIRNGSLKQWTAGNGHVGISDHDVSFWMGDLNYRIVEGISTQDVLTMAKRNQLDYLKRNDQLNMERKEGRVFQGFEEGELTFLPTYKYQPGKDWYDERPDKKVRAPAWCDRVLWKTGDPSYVKQLNYTRSELNVSDHKPVMSTFSVTIKDVIESDREKVYRDVNKILDQYDNKNLPMVGLDRVKLDFGEIRYGQTMTLPIKVTNTGKVVAQYRFIPKPDEDELCKPWLTISPAYGMLIPGEKEESINFTVTVDNVMASSLNSGCEVLEDIVILRLENGRDYYIIIKGQYARSCFGMSVNELVMYSDPIRDVPLDPIKRVEKYGNDQTAKLCVPKELFRLVDAIYEKGLGTRELFSVAGTPNEISQIRECIDTGAPFGDFRIHSFAETLTSFLSNLSASIIPPTHLPNMEIEVQNIQFYARRFVDDLPPIHYNVFVYMMSFFRECLMHQKENGLTSIKVARICYNCLAGTNGSNGVEESKARQSSMILLINHLLEANSI